MRLFPSLIVLISASLVACAGHPRKPPSPITQQEARAFFERYVTLWNAHDLKLIALFADDVHARALRHGPAGDQRLDVHGAQLKDVLRAHLTTAPAEDVEEFTNVVITTSVAGARIQARRSSPPRCVHDDHFSLDLARDAAGALHIVDTYKEDWSRIQCGLGEGKAPAQRFAEFASTARMLKLPRMINPEERLDTLSHDGDELTYGYTLVHVNAAEFDKTQIEPVMRAQLVADSCHKITILVAALRDGGRVTYAYADSAGQPLMRFTVSQEDCR